MPTKVQKSDAEWRALLDDLTYHVTRQAGTERAFTGAYWDCTDPGTYVCVGCDTPLFESEQKFASGCGWPSFTAPSPQADLEELEDRSWNMVRTEVRCRGCDAHLGHVFPDGPRETTGLRYCINSASIQLEEQG
jgi:peptide-methionine (R)-S-oxide reductase